MAISEIRAVSISAIAPLCGVVSPVSDWIYANTDPETADNGGSAVTNPGAITRAALYKIVNDGIWTTGLVTLRYAATGTLTDPVLNIFGFDNARTGNGDIVNYQALKDSNDSSDITLATASGDVTDGTYKWTIPVEVDLKGNPFILCTVKTAFASSGTITAADVLMRGI